MQKTRVTIDDLADQIVSEHYFTAYDGCAQAILNGRALEDGEVLACLREIVEDCDVEFSDEQWRRYRAAISGALGVDSRHKLCGYQHGHAIGCENNPVDIALKARASKRSGS